MLTVQQVLVIGGSEGIGRAVAKTARSLEARVLGVSRTENKLKAAWAVVDDMEIRVADINDDASIRAMLSELSTVDHVYIAADSTKIGGLLDHPLSDFHDKFDEHVRGSVDIVRAAHQLVYPRGSFTFTGSLLSDRLVNGALILGIATIATEQLAHVLALELALVRFNTIAPGYTHTPKWAGIFSDVAVRALDDVTMRHPIPRLVTADKVA